MGMMEAGRIVDTVVEHYLGSPDFNGLSVRVLARISGQTQQGLRAILCDLVSAGDVSVVFDDVHPNPHIRAFGDQSPDVQVRTLKLSGDDAGVVYPSARMLASRASEIGFGDRPFSREVALGAGQLEYRVFDLSVIEFYRRDPRYAVWSNDIHVTLSIGDEAYESDAFPEKHKVLIQHFGYCYSAVGLRAVAVFLCDLMKLTPEHQQLWATHSVTGNFKLHSDYYDSAIRGSFGSGVSLRDALAEEIKTVNAMCTAIGWPPLFRSAPDELPKEVAFLLRPTSGAMNEFVMAADKLLSDNINTAFFPSSIPRQTETLRDDGRIEVRQVGSIALLDQWLMTQFRTPDPTPLKEMLSTLRHVRKLRQKPAHALEEDGYRESLFQEQRELFIRIYRAVKILREVLVKHPRATVAAKGMNELVRSGKIWPR